MRSRSRSVLPLLAALLVAAVAAGGCGRSGPDRRASATVDITVERLRDMLDSKDFLLVNVHTPHEGDISGTDLRIPYDEIGSRVAELPGGKDAKIVLYCRSGHMSAEAAETLAALGYTNVYNVSGGMQAWQAAGY